MIEKERFMKNTIAHEIGHALFAEMADTDSQADWIDFCPADPAIIAFCYMKEEKRKTPPAWKYNYAEVSCLGGLFGELLYFGYWVPWSSRGDFDQFLSSNVIKHKNVLFKELDQWFWGTVRKNSFNWFAKGPFPQRYRAFMSEELTQKNLPLLYEIFLRFKNYADVDAFKHTVDSLYSKKVKNITNSQLRAIQRSVL